MEYRDFQEKQIKTVLEKEKTFLWSRAMDLTHKREDAEDLLQDTIMKIYLGWDRFDPETNFRAWASRIMLNTHINNETRKRENVSCDFSSGGCDAVVALSPAAADYSLNYSDSPEKIFFFNHINENLQEIMYSLEDTFRIPFALYHFEGYSYEDVAKTLRLPLGTVKSRIFRARKTLQDKVEHLAA